MAKASTSIAKNTGKVTAADKETPAAIPAKLSAASPPQLIYLKAESIHPHPLNPRPKSEFYQCNVDDAKVEELIASIQGTGYDLLEPIQVRKIGDTYQIVAGHHRYCALVALNRKEIPAVELDLDEVEAAIRLVARQGKSIEPWDLAHHAYELCKGQEICSQTDYSKKTGFAATLISKWVRAVEVAEFTKAKKLAVTACAAIARAPQDKWQELTDKAIKDKLSSREIEDLVSVAQGKVVEKVEDTEIPQLTSVSSPDSISSTKSVETEQKLTTKNIPNNVPTGLFPPIGVQSNLRSWNAPKKTELDLVLIDRSTLREDLDEAIAAANKLTSKSGRIIIICEPRHTVNSVIVSEDQELTLEQKLIWFRGGDGQSNPEERLWPNSYREILVFKAKDSIGWFDASSTIKHFSLTPSDVFRLGASPGGGISAVLAELLFRTYAPPSAQILIPGAFETQAILAGFRLNHHVTWLESNEKLFQTINEGLQC